MRGALRRWLVAIAIVVLLVGDAGGEEAAGEAARLAIVNDQLARRLELAESSRFYLVVDVAGRRVDLLLEGVLLRSVPLRRAEVGRARVAFVLRPAGDWATRTWSGGRLAPPRREDRAEIVAGAGGDGAREPAIPPSPEERFPAPDAFLVTFDGGFRLEIVAEGSDGGVKPIGIGASIRRRIADAVLSAGFGRRERARLKLVLAAADAAALYRSLPPDVSLLVTLEPGV